MVASTTQPCSLAFVPLIVVLFVGTAHGGTKVKYITGKLQNTAAFDVDKALARAFTLAQEMQMPTGASLPHTNWYQLIDYAAQPRFAEMGQLVLADIQDTATGHRQTDTCTAFYIGRNLLATAAHCLVGHRMDIASGKHFLFFHHRYDALADFPVQTKRAQLEKKMRVGVEWWYPAEFPSLYKQDHIAAGGLDYAFVRVNAAKEQPDAFYALTEPGAMLEKKLAVAVAGYPSDFHNKEKPAPRIYAPVYVTAVPYLPPSKEVKDVFRAYVKSLGSAAKNPPKDDEKMDDPRVKDHQIVAIADEVCFSGGASGGPWLLKEDTKLAVYGISAWAKGRHQTDNPPVLMMDWENEHLKPMGSPRMTKEMTEIQNHLREKTDGKGFITT